MRFPYTVICSLAVFALVGCSSTVSRKPVTELLTADTPKTTLEGNTFIAPSGWNLTVRGPAMILAAPEGDSRIALVDVHAKDADAALAAAWSAYGGYKDWPLKVATDSPDKEGWSNIRFYSYQTSPNERRSVGA